MLPELVDGAIAVANGTVSETAGPTVLFYAHT